MRPGKHRQSHRHLSHLLPRPGAALTPQPSSLRRTERWDWHPSRTHSYAAYRVGRAFQLWQVRACVRASGRSRGRHGCSHHPWDQEQPDRQNPGQDGKREADRPNDQGRPGPPSSRSEGERPCSGGQQCDIPPCRRAALPTDDDDIDPGVSGGRYRSPRALGGESAHAHCPLKPRSPVLSIARFPAGLLPEILQQAFPVVPQVARVKPGRIHPGAETWARTSMVSGWPPTQP